jgi:hypothetical protein
MTPQQFLLKIIGVYQDARISRYADEKIHRGRSHSISSVTEDLFASYLIYADPAISLIYVDQPLRVREYEKSFFPDIVIVKDEIITAFLDLKMDLGWKRRGLIDLCEKDQLLLSKIRGKSCTINDGVTKEKKTFTISSSAVYDIVVVSAENISKKLLADQLEGASKYGNDVSVHILTEKEHPNTYGYSPEDLISKIQINDDAFTEVVARIQ